MKQSHLFLALGTLILTACSSCKEEVEPTPPVIPNEEEVITTLNFTLTPDGGGTAVVFSFQDLDGEGGNDAVVTNGTLAVNTTYTGSVELLNELENPAEDITEEVETEAEEHQFFYQTSLNDLTVAYSDMDANGNPIGIATTVTTGDANSGTLTVTLRHEPIKDGTDVAAGDITNAGGETDIAVTFDVEIE